MSAQPTKISALNIAELRGLARRTLPRGLFEFVDRGTEDEYAIRAYRHAFEAIRFHPRVLVDVSKRAQSTDFFGTPVSTPLAVAPTGAAGLLWFDGEIAIARAAAQVGIPFTLSTASIVSMERVAAEAGGRLWFQLYMWPDRQMSYRLIERVRAAGYEALIVTVDVPVSPNREYNARNGFTLPMRLTHRNIVDVALHPNWFFRVFLRYLMRAGIPMLENYPDELRVKLTAAPGKRYSLPKNDSLTWTDLRELRKRWAGPLIVKGILRPDDAQLALDCGVDGILVSNHGGRSLDFSVSPIEVLPAIVDRINGRAEVFVDSGFQRGSDVVKALALGATGVFVGRAPLWGTAVSGSDGAQVALNIFRDEIDRVMGLLGCSTLEDITIDLLSGSVGPASSARDVEREACGPRAAKGRPADFASVPSEMP
jgi:isopentenyl diphosphate isomerase/L-lactate dehydrogenase-like FMN-dependent dehydrogenase